MLPIIIRTRTSGGDGASFRGAEGPSHGTTPEKGGDVNPSIRANRTSYAFDRRTGKVYIYNAKRGVQAIIPQKNFVKLPK